jgi:hypothetical protein
MPYTPEESKSVLTHFYRTYGQHLWGEYGFYDAFNPQVNWFADSYLAIDQGPIIDMIENYRSGLLWDRFMKNPEISPALEAIGFKEDIVDVAEPPATQSFDFLVYPTITQGEVYISVSGEADIASVEIFMTDILGKAIPFELSGLGAGQGCVQLTNSEGVSGLILISVKNQMGQIRTRFFLRG